MHAPLAFAIATVLAVAPPLVPAEPSSPVTNADDAAELDTIVARARGRFDAGDFDGAIADFEQAYSLRADASFVYNIGRIHEEAGRIEAAIASYRRFIRAPGVALDQRTQALDRIEVLERIRDASHEPTRASEPPPPARDPSPPVRIEPSATPPDREAPGRPAIRTGLGLLGAGAGVAIVGFVIGGLALRDDRALADTGDPARRLDVADRGRGEALAADILVGVGAAVVVAGVVTLAVGVAHRRRAQRRSDTARVHVDPGLVLRF